MNGLLRELHRGTAGSTTDYVAAHTIGFDELRGDGRRATRPDAGRGDLRRPGRRRRAPRAELVGTCRAAACRRCCRASTSRNQATAAACQVNNLHLLRGMLGRPGAGVLQMNGQPTAQNTRETGADGDLPGHAQLGQRRARRASSPSCGTSTRRRSRTGRRRPTRCRSSATPSRARSSCCGSRRPTRPSRCPSSRASGGSCRRDELFVVVQDAVPHRDGRSSPTSCCRRRRGARRPARSPTPTAPCTSPSKAVEPPGEARADLDIFLDYARRMDFRDRDGEPLIKWTTPEAAFEAWKACSRGRPCDYTRPDLRPAARRRRASSGRATASTPTAPSGSTPTASSTPTRTTARPSATTSSTGRRVDRGGVPRARRRTAGRSCRPPTTSRRPRRPSERVPAAADDGPHRLPLPHPHQDRPRARSSTPPRPTSWVELSRRRTPHALGVARGRRRARRVARAARSRRPARVSGIRPGVVFVPFHYGYWDADGDATRPGAPTS